MFQEFDAVLSSAFKEMDAVVSRMNDEFKQIEEKAKKGEIKIRHFVLKDGKLHELPSVPTVDRMSFTEKPKMMNGKNCCKCNKKNTDSDGTAKPLSDYFTKKEADRIIRMRKLGKSIKYIARTIKKSDKKVSEYVRAFCS